MPVGICFVSLQRKVKMADCETNKRVFLRSRPGVCNPATKDNFGFEETPNTACKEGEVLVKTLSLSVDPFLRCRLNEDSGVEYVKAWEVGQTLDGVGVGVVVQSSDTAFKRGDIVAGSMWPFQKFVTFNPSAMLKVGLLSALNKVESELVKEHPSLSLGILGWTGLTAILGIQEMAHITPGKNKTVVVSGAAGACGSAAGQIARLEGCGKVVGICGTDEKCSYLTDELGFDAAVNYKTIADIEGKISGLCPAGVDAYFDNVGGEISNQVIRCMTQDSHVVLCGQMSQYNKDVPYPPPIDQDVQEILGDRNISRERFLVLNYLEKFPEALKQLESWLREGKLKYRETVEVGLEHAGKAFVSMMSGGNIGKQVVQVANM